MTSQAPRSAQVPSSSTPAAGAQSAALRGASLAFQSRAARPAPPQQPLSAAANGALVAATSAASASTPQSGLSRHATGGSAASDRSAFGSEHHQALSHQLSQLQPSSQPGSHLRPSDARPGGPDTRSASFIAATLAASRSASPSPNRQRAGRGAATPQGHRGGTPGAASPPPSLRLYPDRDRTYTSNADGDRPVRDITSPQEPQFPAPDRAWRGREDTDPVKSPPPESAKLRTRPEDGRRRDASDERQTQDTPTKRPPKPKPGPKPRPDNIRTKVLADSGPDSTTAATSHDRDDAGGGRVIVREKIPTPAPRAATAVDSRPDSRPTKVTDERAPATGPTPPPPRRRPASVSQPTARGSSATDRASARRGAPPNQHERTGSLGRDVDGPGTVRTVARARAGSESSDDTFFTTSSGRSGPAPSSPAQDRAEPGVVGRLRPKTPPPPQSSTPGQRQVAAAATHTRVGNHHGPGLALDSLTNAIVASNLASARRQQASEESRAPPPIPVPRRKQRNDLQPPDLSRSYSKSPPKRSGMLQTLRSPPSKSDDEESRRNHERYRKRSSLGKKHMHHEGSRRRWRDQLTAAERRRYAALWASNRGLLLAAPQQGSSDGSGPGQDSVTNVVVRDLWGRSRLPFDELAEVWDLVDLGRRGMLSKEEFVVGTWLVDQRLRGRKIPTRVSQSVWDSVKGLKVPAPGSSG
ncbi:hypothetical protein RB601_007073 [Gaeumannomyces tritici]